MLLFTILETSEGDIKSALLYALMELKKWSPLKRNIFGILITMKILAAISFFLLLNDLGTTLN